MSSVQAMDENCVKLIQIYHLLKNCQVSQIHPKKFLNITNTKAILDNNFNINYKLPRNMCCNKEQYLGNTALHFLIVFNNFNNFKQCFDIFIEHGADLAIQNDSGYTPLLLAFQKSFNVDELLLIYINKKIFSNIKQENGLSHFHVACTTNHIKAIDIYLRSGSSINECVNDSSTQYAGYTPLHFAALYEKFQIMKLLLANGGNMNTKDVNGLTPLHLLIKKCKESSFDCNFFLRVISLRILPDDVGLTNMHINCIMNYDGLFERLLNEDIDIDSPIHTDSPMWPGYTPLHVALQFNLSTAICLLVKRANLLAKDATGTTPFDLCLKQYNLNEIIQILLTEKRHKLSHVKLTDGTCLIDILWAIENNKLKQFIKRKIKNVRSIIPLDSLIWPGYNLFHLAVMFDQHKYSSIHALLSYNVDFTILNKDGMSPLHLAFYLEKKEIVDIILDYHEKILINPVDRNNVSHLHIACAAKDSKAVKVLLNIGSDPNLPTLKDIKYTFYETYVYKTGSTPFDIALGWLKRELVDEIPFPIVIPDDDDEPDKASSYEEPSYRYKWENKQSNVMIDWMLKPEVKAVMTNKISLKILNAALNNGYECNKEVVDKLFNEIQLDQLGLTKLQVACALGNLSVVKEELESGANVNQQIAFDSNIWPGDTALHINSQRKKYSSDNLKLKIAEILLAHGANPHLKNANNLTPIHLSDGWEMDAVIQLLSSKKFPILNLSNNDGLTHFHLICKTSNFHLVKEFIKSGVNINTPVNYLANYYAGYTPLHFAIRYSSKEVIQMLLSHGADPNMKTAKNLTAFYMAVFDNVNKDPIKTFLRSKLKDNQDSMSSECMINLLCDKGVCMNFAHLITDGFIQNVLKMASCLTTPTFLRLINNISGITDVDKQGQNIIFYIRSDTNKNAFNNFDMLVQNGFEINHKNYKGKTPLHQTVDYLDGSTAKLLLSLGADVNIKDDQGKTALFHAYKKSCKSEQFKYLIVRIVHMKEVGMYVNELNETIFRKAYVKINLNKTIAEKLKLNDKLKKKVNPSFSVDYFFTEEFVVDYKRMTVFQRQTIRNICESDHLHKKFPGLHELIKLQLRKARSRTRLLEPAKAAFRTLGYQAIPELCLDSIMKYLNNDDLMNLVRSKSGKLVFAPLRNNY